MTAESIDRLRQDLNVIGFFAFAVVFFHLGVTSTTAKLAGVGAMITGAQYLLIPLQSNGESSTVTQQSAEAGESA